MVVTKLWVLAGAVVVVAVAAVTVVLTSGDGDPTAAPRPSGKPGYDLSSPKAAAESLAKAATTGSGDTLLRLTCVGHQDCVREHAATLSQDQVAEERDTIREGVYELAEHLKGAEFAAAVDGDEPGTKSVPYRTPAMTGDGYLSLTFVKSGDDWLYYRPTTG